jgi:hypothetical protein
MQTVTFVKCIDRLRTLNYSLQTPTVNTAHQQTSLNLATKKQDLIKMTNKLPGTHTQYNAHLVPNWRWYNSAELAQNQHFSHV